MPLAYRIQKARHLDTVLLGEGARRFGGRWNPPGVPLLYTSTTPEQALLENLVHLDETPLEELPEFILLELDIPDSIEFSDEERLPDGWHRVPEPPGLNRFLLPFLRPNAALAFSVPSVVMPWSRNLLINPLHPLMNAVQIVRQEPFRFDGRLR